MQSAMEQHWQLRKRLAQSILIAAALLTPTLWIPAGSLVGDFLNGVWLGTLAAFVAVAGPLAAPAKPLVSRFLVVVGVLAIGAAIVWLSPSGFGVGGGAGKEGVGLIAFVVGALAGHASWTLQINRLTAKLKAIG